MRGEWNGQSNTLVLGADACRALNSDAWNRNPSLVHAWGILGPTELLDLRKLPAHWNQPAFDDRGWPQAVVRQPTAPDAIYQLRSMATLVNVPITPAIYAVGRVSPGAWVGEITADTDGSARYRFELSEPGEVIFQALAAPDQPAPADAARLDDAALPWSALEDHPDRYAARVQLAAGAHVIRADGFRPGDTWVFSLTSDHINTAPPPLGDSANAGRRLLLPDLVADPGAAAITVGAGLDLSVGPGPTYVILDLGRTVYGRLRVEALGSVGTVIDIGWDERLWHGYRPLPFPGSIYPAWNQSDSWVLPDDARTLTTIDARAGRYALIVVWSATTTTLRNLQVLEERYPLAQRGSF
ncbi:MAG: hypothetical protein HGA65_16875, partial [Oscillochloris sp.]|nr:hypothetical protein [Oscillochloris sp.]